MDEEGNHDGGVLDYKGEEQRISKEEEEKRAKREKGEEGKEREE